MAEGSLPKVEGQSGAGGEQSERNPQPRGSAGGKGADLGGSGAGRSTELGRTENGVSAIEGAPERVGGDSGLGVASSVGGAEMQANDGDLDSMLASLGVAEGGAISQVHSTGDGAPTEGGPSENGTGTNGTPRNKGGRSAVMVPMAVTQMDSRRGSQMTAVRVDVEAAARGEAIVKSGQSELVDLPESNSVATTDLGGGGASGQTVELNSPDQRSQAVGVRSLQDDAAELGRVHRPAGVDAEHEEFLPVYRSPIWVRAARWAAVVGVAVGAAGLGWWLAAPPGLLRAQVMVEGMNDPSGLLVATGVRELAITKLATQSPGTSPGELENDDAIRKWADLASGSGGMLVVEIPAAGDGGDVLDTVVDRSARLRALLTAVAERAVPERSTSAAQLAILSDTRAGAEDALAAGKVQLAELEARAKESPKLAGLTAAATAAQTHRDGLAARLLAIRNDPAPVIDPVAQRKLDAAVASFQSQLSAVQAKQGQDPKLAAFIAVAQNIQDESARLTDAILARRQDEAARLVQLKRRLDERMRVRQQQIWDGDEELKKLATQLEETRRRYEATDPGNVARRQDLQGELDYLDGLIKSRKVLIGADKGDQRALAEVQSIIDEQAAATQQDQQRLNDSFAKMRQTLSRMRPDATSAQAGLAKELEARLGELQEARSGLADASANALAKQEQLSRQLEAELVAADQDMVTKQAAAEQVRATLPNTRQLDEARARVERLTTELETAGKALAEAQKLPVHTPPGTPTVVTRLGDAPLRVWFAVLPGSVMLALGVMVLRHRD